MKVRITQTAYADLRDIGHWIALDDPERAITFVRELAEKCLSLADRAFLYPPAPEAGEGVRKRRHRKYLILYPVGAETIEVLHVIHPWHARLSEDVYAALSRLENRRQGSVADFRPGPSSPDTRASSPHCA